MPHARPQPAPLAATVAASLALLGAASPSPPPSPADMNRLAWHMSGASADGRYASETHMTHVVSYDMNKALRAFAGSRADTVTIMEDRTMTLALGPGGAVNETVDDVRRYGGDNPKDKSVVRRNSAYKGTMTADGLRTPSQEPLVDAGAGALDQLPTAPIDVGSTWTFTRRILVEREIGQGTMTYKNVVSRIDVRNGHRIAVINVTGNGRVDVFQELQAKGFRTADMALKGTAEFDMTDGLPGAQHYTAHAEWSIRPFGVHIGLIFDDTYDAQPWKPKTQ